MDAKTSQQSKALEVRPGEWVWDGVVKVLEVDLFSPNWEVRHGAAMGLREVLKIQGKCGGMRGKVDHKYAAIRFSFPCVFVAGASTSENATSHEQWCNAISAKFLCVFVLDRFGDFVSDQVWDSIFFA